MTGCVLNLNIAEVAQSVEQGTENPRVSGSIPFLGISFLSNPRHLSVPYLLRESISPHTDSGVRCRDSIGRVPMMMQSENIGSIDEEVSLNCRSLSIVTVK